MSIITKTFSRYGRAAQRAFPTLLLSALLTCLTLAARAQGLQRNNRPLAPPALLQPFLGMAPLASSLLPPLQPGQNSLSGDLLIGLDPDADETRFRQQIQQLGQLVGRSLHLHVYRLRLNEGIPDALALTWLRQQTGVTFAHNNHRIQIAATAVTPNDANYNLQWNLPQIKADQAWPLWKPQGQVVLAIVDTGVDYTHPDLVNMMFTDTAGNVIGHDSTGSNSFLDGYGHGTHCAGIAAAQSNNATSYTNPNTGGKYGIAGAVGWNGVAGTTDTSHIKIMPVRVLDSTGSGSDATVSEGIEWAADHGAQVISMSLGEPEDPNNPGPPAAVNAAVQYAWKKGVVIVAAAGNDGSTEHFYPAACSNVISVAATDSTDTLASFSNYGSWVNVAAPGVNVFSTLPTYGASGGYGTNYGYLSGTSMATPHVAAEAALLLGQKLTLTNAQVHDAIIANVDAIQGTNTISNGNGGRINFLSALNAETTTVSTTTYHLNCGGSAVGSFTADDDNNGGTTYTTGNGIDTGNVTNPAPQSVYQSCRYNTSGPVTYTLPNLTAGATYTVRLHFADPSASYVGQRLFNITLNGSVVQSNFDVFAAAGGANKAIVKEFSTTADSTGTLVISLTRGRIDPFINGIEVSIANSSTLPDPPTALAAAAQKSSINLSWTASANTTSYNIKRGTNSKGPFTTIATLRNSTTYLDGGTNFDGSAVLSPKITYYYIVTGMNYVGESQASNVATIAVSTTTYHLNCGGSAVGSFTADDDNNGGTTYTTGNGIDTGNVTNPAPQSVYQSCRYNTSGPVTYTLPNLTAGATYTVRLHFADPSASYVGQRLFNITLNGSVVQSNFDVFAAAGGANKAIVKEFSTTADSTGTLVISLTRGRIDPFINGIEVY